MRLGTLIAAPEFAGRLIDDVSHAADLRQIFNWPMSRAAVATIAGKAIK